MQSKQNSLSCILPLWFKNSSYQNLKLSHNYKTNKKLSYIRCEVSPFLY